VLAGSIPLIADLILAIDLLDDAVILLHEDGRIIHCNHAASILALPVRSAGIHSLRMLGPEEPWATIRHLLRDYQTQSGFLERDVRDPGTGRSWNLRLTALAYLGVSPRRLILVIRDITEAVRTKERLAEQEVMAATGALLAGAAHQAKNSIFGLSATLDAFEAHLNDAAADNDYVRNMRLCVGHMQVLMRDLLDYGTPSVRCELQPTSLAAIVRRSMSDCRPLARASGIELIAEIAEGATIAANASRLGRAVENLLENAIQHSPPQGTVTARMVPSGAGAVRLDVTDEGPGFPPEHMEKLFTPFFTLRPGGTGLGLTIAKKIVEDLNGAIRLSNDAARGARVTVLLPVLEGAKQELRPAISERERGRE
jgi:signal transduction histidine kinase